MRSNILGDSGAENGGFKSPTPTYAAPPKWECSPKVTFKITV